jgi:hypothetical protein
MAKIITRDARPDDLMFREGIIRHSLPLVRRSLQSKTSTPSGTAGPSTQGSWSGSNEAQDTTRKPTSSKGGPVDR